MIETLAGGVLRGGYDMSAPVRRSDPAQISPSALFADDITDLWQSHTDSGELVTPSTAYTFEAVQSAIRFLSELEASYPCHLYRRRPDGIGKDRATDHYLYPLLHDSPNEEQTSFEFWQAMRQNRAGWGNAYGLLRWMPNGRWSQIIPLRPDWMRVTRNSNNTKVYQYRPASGPYEGDYISSDIVHVRGMGDDLVGWSPIKLMRQSIGRGMAAGKASAAFFKNGAKMSGVLSVSGKVREEDQKSFNEKYAGAHNAGKVLVVGTDSKFVSTTIPPDDAQFLETIKDAGRFVWMVYGIPPFIMGDTEKSTSWGTGIEQQALGFLKFNQRPSLEMTQQAFENKLLGRGNREYFIEFDLDSLLQADAKTRADVLAIKRQNGIVNADEWRALDNQNPIGGEEGSAYLVNGTMIPVRVALAKANTEPTQPQQ